MRHPDPSSVSDPSPAELPADVAQLCLAHGLPSFAYFDQQFAQEVRRAQGAWPLLAREWRRRATAPASGAASLPVVTGAAR
ncbi:MAG: hypothetical protein N3C59_00855 [Azovibrio sp.]|nr:hypothetical protein [Azovibrio sp.]